MDELFKRSIDPLDETIEDALRTLPVAEPPPSLMAGIIVQVQPRSAFEKPVFRVTWMDFAISLFFAVMIGMAMLLAYRLPEQISMQLSMHLRTFELLHFDWVLWIAIGMSVLACTSAGVVFSANQISRSTR